MVVRLIEEDQTLLAVPILQDHRPFFRQLQNISTGRVALQVSKKLCHKTNQNKEVQQLFPLRMQKP